MNFRLMFSRESEVTRFNVCMCVYMVMNMAVPRITYNLNVYRTHGNEKDESRYR